MLASSDALPTLETIDEMMQELVNLAQKSPVPAGQTMKEMIGRLCSITQKSMPGLETVCLFQYSSLVIKIYCAGDWFYGLVA